MLEAFGGSSFTGPFEGTRMEDKSLWEYVTLPPVKTHQRSDPASRPKELAMFQA